jgi:hypothetical protein
LLSVPSPKQSFTNVKHFPLFLCSSASIMLSCNFFFSRSLLSARSDLGALLSSLLQNKNLKRKLENYAALLLYKRTKNGFARHVLPSDIISTISLKLLDGNIVWDKDKCSLIRFFNSRLRSEVANLFKKEMKFIPVPLEDSETFSDYEGDIDDDVSLPPQFIIDPFEDNNDEEEIDPVEFKKIAYEIFSDSDEEFCVLDEMFKGHKSNLIALNLGLTERQVHNIKRRVIRILKAWVLRNKKKNTILYKQLVINNNKPQKISEPQPRRFSEPPRFSKNPLDKNKPGKSTPDNNNNGELS